MSRSRKKTPFIQIACAESEAQDKKRWHRKMRHGEKLKLKAMQSEYQVPSIHKYSDPWLMAKDGKLYRPEARWVRYLRK